MEEEFKEVLEALYDCYRQSCYRDGEYYHQFISAYEDAEDVLIKYGKIDIKDTLGV